MPCQMLKLQAALETKAAALFDVRTALAVRDQELDSLKQHRRRTSHSAQEHER